LSTYQPEILSVAAGNASSVSVADDDAGVQEKGGIVMVLVWKCLVEPYLLISYLVLGFQRTFSGKAAENFWIWNPFLELGFQSN
jgi:hypothetical protein